LRHWRAFWGEKHASRKRGSFLQVVSNRLLIKREVWISPFCRFGREKASPNNQRLLRSRPARWFGIGLLGLRRLRRRATLGLPADMKPAVGFILEVAFSTINGWARRRNATRYTK